MKPIPRTILVADDEPDVRSLLCHWLGKLGHTVIPVSSAKAASELLPQRPFDLLITDLLMPEGDGLDLIAQFKHAQPAASILAISGGGRFVPGDNCLESALRLGAHAALMKPFSREQLLAAVESALAPQSKLVWEK